MDYGDYGDYYGKRNRNGYSRVHQVRFLASCRMGSMEPTPDQVLDEVRRVIYEYRSSRNRPRKYSINVSPTDVLIREESDSYHEETIQTKYIHYCVHDVHYPNIFAFVAWSQSQGCFLAHIFYCRDEEDAENLKAAFANGFQSAFKDYRADKEFRGPPIRRPRDTYSEYGPPRLTRGEALDYHRRSYEAPAVMEREHYRPPPRVQRPRARSRPRERPHPNQLIEVYGNPVDGGYDYDDDDDDFMADAPAPRQPAVEKEVVYTRETFQPPNFGHESGDYGRRRPAYDDGPAYAPRGRRPRRYVENGYGRDDMYY